MKPPAHTTVPALPPVYLLAGGGPSHRAAYHAVLAKALAGAGSVSPSVAYLGAASGDDRSFFRMMAGYLQAAGAGDVLLAPTVGVRGAPAKAIDVMEKASAIFVSGGDVEEGMKVLRERELVPHLARLQGAGKPFIGISAGSIMLAASWVCWSDADDDDSAELFPCLGLAPVLCDTHGESEGWGELRTLVRIAGPASVGYGIPSGGTLRVDRDGSVRAFGPPVKRFRNEDGRVVADGQAEGI